MIILNNYSIGLFHVTYPWNIFSAGRSAQQYAAMTSKYQQCAVWCTMILCMEGLACNLIYLKIFSQSLTCEWPPSYFLIYWLRYGSLVLAELRAIAPVPGDDHLRFKRWLIKVFRESEAPVAIQNNEDDWQCFVLFVRRRVIPIPNVECNPERSRTNSRWNCLGMFGPHVSRCDGELSESKWYANFIHILL